jgi:hypothetical protein
VKVEIDEYHPGSPIHVGNNIYFTLPSTSRREAYKKVEKQQQGKPGVPTLMLDVGGASFALPPASLVSRELAYSLAACEPRRAKPGSEREIYESELARSTLDPWRLGLYWPDALDDLFKRDADFIPR